MQPSPLGLAEHVRGTTRAIELPAGCFVSQDGLGFRIPGEGPPKAFRNAAEMANGRGAVPDLCMADWGAAGLDAFEPVCVMLGGIVEPNIFVR